MDPARKKHPRLRGEDRRTEGNPRREGETPPLTRGRLGAAKTRETRSRNTPAYAGKTPSRKTFADASRKHPRLRGEDESIRFSSRNHSETPPLTRGRRRASPVGRARSRNTPAYAGKTTDPRRSAWRCRKHPRLRGEDPPKSKPTRSRWETPPLTRGRPSGFNAIGRGFGNTPAYAGKTLPPVAASLSSMETPPLTRGRHAKVDGGGLADGNTPAYAGKTRDLRARYCH